LLLLLRSTLNQIPKNTSGLLQHLIHAHLLVKNNSL